MLLFRNIVHKVKNENQVLLKTRNLKTKVHFSANIDPTKIMSNRYTFVNSRLNPKISEEESSGPFPETSKFLKSVNAPKYDFKFQLLDYPEKTKEGHINDLDRLLVFSNHGESFLTTPIAIFKIIEVAKNKYKRSMFCAGFIEKCNTSKTKDMLGNGILNVELTLIDCRLMPQFLKVINFEKLKDGEYLMDKKKEEQNRRGEGRFSDDKNQGGKGVQKISKNLNR